MYREEDIATLATINALLREADEAILGAVNQTRVDNHFRARAEQTRARDALAQVRELAPRLVRTQVSFWRE